MKNNKKLVEYATNNIAWLVLNLLAVLISFIEKNAILPAVVLTIGSIYLAYKDVYSDRTISKKRSRLENKIGVRSKKLFISKNEIKLITNKNTSVWNEHNGSMYFDTITAYLALVDWLKKNGMSALNKKIVIDFSGDYPIQSSRYVVSACKEAGFKVTKEQDARCKLVIGDIPLDKPLTGC